MSVQSMTGYGCGESEIDGVYFRIEIRAVNHKNLDIRVRMPRELLFFERDVISQIRAHVSRGHLEVFVSPRDGGTGLRSVQIDRERVAHYVNAWRDIGEVTASPAPVSLEWLAGQDGVVTAISSDLDAERTRSDLNNGVLAAVHSLVAMREEEGATLSKDLLVRLDILQKISVEMEKQAPKAEEAAKERVSSRIESLKKKLGEDLDDGRVEQELALMAERMDIAEEIVRLRSHIDQMRNLLSGNGDDACGKRLGFLVQELFREATTIGSKAGDLPLSNLSVDARCEVERVREQVMNIE